MKSTVSFNTNTFNGLEVEFPDDTPGEGESALSVYGIYLTYAKLLTFNVRQECYNNGVYGLVLDYQFDSSSLNNGPLDNITYNLSYIAGNKSLILNEANIVKATYTQISLFRNYSYKREAKVEFITKASSITGYAPYIKAAQASLELSGWRTKRFNSYSVLDKNPCIILSVSQYQSFRIANLPYDNWSVIGLDASFNKVTSGLTLRRSTTYNYWYSPNTIDFMVLDSAIKYVIIEYYDAIELYSNMPILPSRANFSPAFFTEDFTEDYNNNYGYEGQKLYKDDLTYKTYTSGAWV